MMALKAILGRLGFRCNLYQQRERLQTATETSRYNKYRELQEANWLDFNSIA